MATLRACQHAETGQYRIALLSLPTQSIMSKIWCVETAGAIPVRRQALNLGKLSGQKGERARDRAAAWLANSAGRQAPIGCTEGGIDFRLEHASRRAAAAVWRYARSDRIANLERHSQTSGSAVGIITVYSTFL